MIRGERLRDCDAEAVREHRGERCDLHRAEPGEGGEPFLQIVGVGRLAPDAGGIAAVVLRDDRRQLSNTAGHRAGEAVDRRLLTEGLLEIELRQLPWIERADALLQGEWPREGLLHRHLLVDREAHQQSE